MARSTSNIQTALDNALAAVSGVTVSGPSANLFTENDPLPDFASMPSTTGKVFVRSAMVPLKSAVEVIGGSFILDHGFYTIDVFGELDQGSAAVKALADAIMNAFYPGLTLSTAAGPITIESSSPSPNITEGAWQLEKFYAVQILVDWFQYAAT